MLLAAYALAGCVTESTKPQPWDDEQRVELRVELAWDYMRRAQLDVALGELQTALKLKPNDSQANYAMGVLQLQLHRNDKAERYLRKAVGSDPDNQAARRSLGAVLCSQGRTDAGMREIDMLLRDPLDSRPAMTRARAGQCTEDSDPEQAERYFRGALAMDPELGAALFPLVRITYGRDDYLAARGFLERYLAANPKTANSLWYGVRIERRLGATEVADDYARQLRADFPRSRQARELLDAGG